MKLKNLIADIDAYATALSKASRWHDSEQSICFNDELSTNHQRFYIRDFLEMLQQLEVLQSKKYKIRLEPGEHLAPYLFSWENREPSKQPEFKAILGKEEIRIKPKIRKTSQAFNNTNGIIIRIRDMASKRQLVPQVSQKLKATIDCNESLSQFDFQVIEGLPEDCVYATKMKTPKKQAYKP